MLAVWELVNIFFKKWKLNKKDFKTLCMIFFLSDNVLKEKVKKTLTRVLEKELVIFEIVIHLYDIFLKENWKHSLHVLNN